MLAGSVVVAISRNLANAYFLASTVTVPVPIAAQAPATSHPSKTGRLTLGGEPGIGCAIGA
jgi:hypothetical protein